MLWLVGPEKKHALGTGKPYMMGIISQHIWSRVVSKPGSSLHRGRYLQMRISSLESSEKMEPPWSEDSGSATQRKNRSMNLGKVKA